MSDAQNQQVVDGEEQQEEEVVDLRSDDAVNKFRAACEVVNQTLKLLLKVAAEGKKTTEVADIGEQLIMKQVAAQFGKNKGMEKGPAFPVSVAVNEVVGNVSPLKSEAEEGRVLKKGDLVKIALGAHFDGYVAVGAHSFVVGASAAAPVDGPAADVMLASYYAAQAALKSIEVDKKNSDVTKAIAEVAKCYGVQPVEGVLMHQMKRCVALSCAHAHARARAPASTLRSPAASQRRNRPTNEAHIVTPRAKLHGPESNPGSGPWYGHGTSPRHGTDASSWCP